MLDYILLQAQKFEQDHGVAPNVVYINPVHFESLFRDYPDLFAPDQEVRLGFKLAIQPSSQLSHPHASLLMHSNLERNPYPGGEDDFIDLAEPLSIVA